MSINSILTASRFIKRGSVLPLSFKRCISIAGSHLAMAVQGSENSIMTQLNSMPVTHEAISDAANQIENFCHMTPVMTSSQINKQTGKSLHFKAELFQKTGSFKYRGATSSVLKLKEVAKDRITSKQDLVLVTHSSGNHGQAVTLAAKEHGYKAVIVVPRNAPKLKVDAIKSHGGQVTQCEPTHEGRMMACQKVIDDIGDCAEFIPSADHPLVMCGQGTMSMEMLKQVPNLDALVVSVGGGGMLAGMAVAAKAIKPSIKVYAAEPELANDVALSFEAKKRITFTGELSKTVADGLRTNVGVLTWDIIQKTVDGVITVSDEEIIDAMKSSWYHMKMTIETSAACGLAAVDQQKSQLLKEHENIGIVLCGGNVDLDKLPWIPRS